MPSTAHVVFMQNCKLIKFSAGMYRFPYNYKTETFSSADAMDGYLFLSVTQTLTVPVFVQYRPVQRGAGEERSGSSRSDVLRSSARTSAADSSGARTSAPLTQSLGAAA